MARDHGGDIDRARTTYGGAVEDWIDLSTGINRAPYPVPELGPDLWQGLPTGASEEALIRAAAQAYGTRAAVCPLAGAQAGIQIIPRLLPKGRARVLGPTYNEHLGSLIAAGWDAVEVTDPADLVGADLAVIVNPNNPDGRSWAPDQVMTLRSRVGALLVDESFGDVAPETSVAGLAGEEGLFVLRSFGKFFGLAGVRLGFAIGSEDQIAAMREMAGPWAVSGPALEIGRVALTDATWIRETRDRLAAEAQRLDGMAKLAGWDLVGGTDLFRTYGVGDAAGVQDHLARARIWSRIFPYAPGWIRLGLPGAASEWDRLDDALSN